MTGGGIGNSRAFATKSSTRNVADMMMSLRGVSVADDDDNEEEEDVEEDDADEDEHAWLLAPAPCS